MPAKIAAVLSALPEEALSELAPERHRPAAVLEFNARPRLTRLQKWRAFGRLTKPNLTLFVVSTTLLGLHLGTPHLSWRIVLATLCGTALCSGGACGLNMVIERRADALMRRTRARPLPAGEITPRAATFFCLALLLAGATLLAAQTNLLTMALSLLSAAVYVFLYTPMKMRTPWATWVGAIPGALPPVMGFTAARGALDVQAFGIFAILFFWQLPHFYALAVMYREDYARGGFKVQPQLVGGFDVAALERQVACGTLALLAASFSMYWAHFAGAVYVVGAMSAGVFVAFRALQLLHTHSISAARKLFFSTLFYLPILVTALLLDA